MIRNGLIAVFAFFAVLGADADEHLHSPNCDLSCVYEEIWLEISVLQQKDQDRLKPNFLGAVAASEDANLIAFWENRLGIPVEPLEPYDNYALSKVERFLNVEGWEAFFERSQRRAHPFNTGRPEMMAAAAQHLADEQTSLKILSHMEDFAQTDVSEAGFERSAFGHVLAEAYMRRCDLTGFDRSLRLTDAPDALRYAFWRTRMEGKPGDLTWRLQDISKEQKVMFLRQALDGMTDVLSLGNCKTHD